MILHDVEFIVATGPSFIKCKLHVLCHRVFKEQKVFKVKVDEDYMSTLIVCISAFFITGLPFALGYYG